MPSLKTADDADFSRLGAHCRAQPSLVWKIFTLHPLSCLRREEHGLEGLLHGLLACCRTLPSLVLKIFTLHPLFYLRGEPSLGEHGLEVLSILSISSIPNFQRRLAN